MAAATSHLGFLLLTVNSIMAIRRSRGDAATTTFVVASYACLVLLFHCLRRFETAAPGSADQDRAQAGVYLLTTLLTTMFSWRIAALVSWPLGAAGVWFLAAATVLGGYYALFLRRSWETEH